MGSCCSIVTYKDFLDLEMKRQDEREKEHKVFVAFFRELIETIRDKKPATDHRLTVLPETKMDLKPIVEAIKEIKSGKFVTAKGGNNCDSLMVPLQNVVSIEKENMYTGFCITYRKDGKEVKNSFASYKID